MVCEPLCCLHYVNSVNNVNLVLCSGFTPNASVRPMAIRQINVPSGLKQLKHSSELESVPVSRLARKGTEVLTQITESAQAVAVQVQGLGSMVTLSRRQYDEMVDLISHINAPQTDDGFNQALTDRFDAMVATMNQPGAADAAEAALFTAAETLSASYRPGTTETRTGDAD